MNCSSRKGDVDYISRVWPFQPEAPVRSWALQGWDRSGVVCQQRVPETDKLSRSLSASKGKSRCEPQHLVFWSQHPSMGLECSERTTSNTEKHPRSLALSFSSDFSCAGCFQGEFSKRLEVIDV